MKNVYKKNIKTYILFRTFVDLIILGPIIMIYLYAKGLSFAEIMLLNTIFSVAVFILEVPTGMLADKISRKYSLVVGSLCWTVQLILTIYASSFFMFMIAQFFCALGITFKSGATTAIIYDSLKTMKREKEISRYEGLAHSMVLYGQAIGSIAAGFLFTVNIHLPLIISAINTTIAAIIALNFVEPPIEDKRDNESYFTHIKDSSLYILKNGKIKAIVVYGAVFSIFFKVGFFFFQPYFEAVNLDVIYFGLFFALFNVVAGLTSQNASNIMKRTKTKTLTFLSSIMIISFGIMSITTVWVGAFAILLQQVARGLYGPVIAKYVNKHIPSNKRATIMSLYSLITSLTAAAFYPIFGVIMDNRGVFFTHKILTFSMLFLTTVSLVYYNQAVKKENLLTAKQGVA